MHYYDFAPDTQNLILDPEKLTDRERKIERNGYHIEGWYRTKTSDGDEVQYSGKWDFSSDRVGNEGVTLYARWERNIVYTYNVCYRDESGVTQILGSYTVNAGAKFRDMQGLADSYEGHTFLGTFYDESGAVWNENFTHPGGETDTAVNVYGKYMPGEYKLVRTASDLLTAGNKNIWLMNDIDMGGKTLRLGDYSGTFEGNDHRIYNFALDATGDRNSLFTDAELTPDASDNSGIMRVSLFHSVQNATLRNVTFAANETVIDVTFSGIKHICIAPLSLKLKDSTLDNVQFTGAYRSVRLPDGITPQIAAAGKAAIVESNAPYINGTSIAFTAAEA
ncbi:MAG: hypothetical protein K2L51_05510 [Clostridiales bacterium]|nr:hypothetical protein [Clostridiales bacterium]